jgi:hypothetical protein
LRFIRSYTRTLALTVEVLFLALALSSATETTTTTHKPPAKKPVHHLTRNARQSQTSHKGKRSRKASASRKRGQQKIDPERARQIQEALIHEHYLSGKASGNWDAATQQAMQKFQADNGWQSKTTPDSRALIKLGLGPDQQHLLNPESAMTSAPQPGQAVSSRSKTADPPDSVHPQSQ